MKSPFGRKLLPFIAKLPPGLRKPVVMLIPVLLIALVVVIVIVILNVI